MNIYKDNTVQDILSGRRRKFPTKQTAIEELPLRGFLKRSRCGANLTGSKSKGRHQYYYYHCTPQCGERIKAPDANLQSGCSPGFRRHK